MINFTLFVQLQIMMLRLKRLREKIALLLSKIYYDARTFGGRIAFWNFLGELRKISFIPYARKRKILQKKSALILSFLKKEFKDFIENYRYVAKKDESGPNKIRCFWWQGFENAPEIVKICVKNIRKYQGNYELILVDEKNFGKYVEIPKRILKKVEKNQISITHFSDILRMKLLATHGGIWIDATMFVSEDVFSHFKRKELYSTVPKKIIEKNGEFTKWCCFFIGGTANQTFNFVYDFFIEYLSRYQNFIDFFLLDYTLELAYQHFEEAKVAFDNITLENNQIFDLVWIFNEKYDEIQYKKLIKSGYSKLTHKIPFSPYNSKGELTNYGKFIQDFS